MSILILEERKKGDKAQQLHMWKCKAIINKLKHNAYKYKMRFARVSAKNTSILAYDGSGKLIENCSYSNEEDID